MPVFKRNLCDKCQRVRQVDKPAKNPPKCEKCGGSTRYSDKWYIAIWVVEQSGKKRKLLKAVSTNRRFTEEYEAKLVTQRAAGEFFDPQTKATFTKTASEFISFCEQRVLDGNLQPSTLSFYRERLVPILSHFGTWETARITPLAIEEYKQARIKDVKPATVNRDLATLKRIFSVLMKQGKVKFNPVMQVEFLREDNKRDRVLTEDEIDRLLEECKKSSRHLYLAVLVALETGLRLEGCIALKWDDIDFQLGEITRVVKGRKVVRIPMTKKLKATLERHRMEVPVSISGYVIPSPKNPMQPMRTDADFGFYTACRRAGIEDFKFHDLRRTFATRFISRAGDLHTLAMLLGHSSTYITERYAYLLDEVRRERMRQFEEG